MTLQTPLIQSLDLTVPIILAPMAGIAGGALAVAVSGAGGLGLIGGGYGDRGWIEREFEIAGGERIGIGFITWALARQPELLSLALERGPRAVLLSFGDLRPFAPSIARAGIPLIAQVQTVEDARIAVGEGATIIVAQGTEAGGHSGERATMALVPAVVDAVAPVPVIAAGGIADGRGLAAALMLGAAGVLCGTVFYAAAESLAHQNAKKRVVEASGDHTVKGSVFDVVRGYDWPTPWAIRTLRNAFYDRWSRDLDDVRRTPGPHRKSYSDAQDRGNVEVAAVIVGEAVDLVRTIEPASALVERVLTEASDCLANGAKLLDLSHRGNRRSGL
ncbi:nitronate monooxygenase [Aquabacter sp. L1I39]|uniref:NAD(P)H-dependent flavin oxidoreductase n=1 Tax=Aquabacter sp. L1I39 TaxID=2820278 RepID=UPI001ADB604D|nr:nitronate monooxygenase [Aquabacter sp. L1I39]QTL04035.1 nitronate monooxygenase [Aquabacter sp. L1I39]